MNKQQAAVVRAAKIVSLVLSGLLVILGVILIGLIQNNLIMLGVPSYWQTFVVGAVIVVGTAITSLKAKAIEKNAKI